MQIALNAINRCLQRFEHFGLTETLAHLGGNFGIQASAVNATATALNNVATTDTFSFDLKVGGGGGAAHAVTVSHETEAFIAPDAETHLYVVCEVTDIYQASDKDSILILIRDPGNTQTGEMVAHYLFANNADDETGNENHGSVWSCLFTEDMAGNSNQAIELNLSSSKVIMANNGGLNFQDGLTFSYWININELFSWESYPVSHGNWTTRWKTSITGDRLRFTINGSGGIVDVDSKRILETDIWYHILGLYNGMDVLVFINGVLEGYAPLSGTINTTSYDLVIGQSLPDQTGFNYKGLMDNLRIYNYGISYEEMKEIYEDERLGIMDSPDFDKIQVYPNPLKDNLHFEVKTKPGSFISISVYDIMGQNVLATEFKADHLGFLKQELDFSTIKSGAYILKTETETKNYLQKIIVSE